MYFLSYDWRLRWQLTPVRLLRKWLVWGSVWECMRKKSSTLIKRLSSYMSHYSVLSALPLICIDFAKITFLLCSWRALLGSFAPDRYNWVQNHVLYWGMKKPFCSVRVTSLSLRCLLRIRYSEYGLKNVWVFFHCFPSLAQWRGYCCISKLSQKFLPESCPLEFLVSVSKDGKWEC